MTDIDVLKKRINRQLKRLCKRGAGLKAMRVAGAFNMWRRRVGR